MHGCMNGWINEWMNEWIHGWMNSWMSECMNERINAWMNEWMNERMHELNAWMNECMDTHTHAHAHTHTHTHPHTHTHTYTHTHSRTQTVNISACRFSVSARKSWKLENMISLIYYFYYYYNKCDVTYASNVNSKMQRWLFDRFKSHILQTTHFVVTVNQIVANMHWESTDGGLQLGVYTFPTDFESDLARTRQ